MTKLYGLIALTAGALMLAPALAQSLTLTDWMACMDLWADEAICGTQPGLEPSPEPEPAPDPEPEPAPEPAPDPEPEPAPEPEPEVVQEPTSHAVRPSIPDAASAKGKLHGQQGIDTAHDAQQGHDDFGHFRGGDHAAGKATSGQQSRR